MAINKAGMICDGQHFLLWLWLYYFCFTFFFLPGLGIKKKELQTHEFSTDPTIQFKKYEIMVYPSILMASGFFS